MEGREERPPGTVADTTGRTPGRQRPRLPLEPQSRTGLLGNGEPVRGRRSSQVGTVS